MGWRGLIDAIDEERRERGPALVAVVLFALAVATAAGWMFWSQRDAGPALDERVVVLPAPAAAVGSPPPDAVPVRPAMAAARASGSADPTTCPHQRLDIRDASGTRHAGCVSATRTGQRGSLRTYRVDAEGASPWSLSIDAAGEQIVAVRLRRAAYGAAGDQRFACSGHGCGAAALGAPDAHGARVLHLQDLALSAVSGDAAVVRLDARLRIEPDAQQALPACPEPELRVVADGGASVQPFCALGGAGFEVQDDGRIRYVFRDLEGRQLTIDLGADQAVEQVRLGGYACRGPSCSGVATQVQGDPADPASERSFSFSGAVLTSGPTRSAALDGALTMPAQ